MEVWIGTSGFSYSDWVGPFYRSGTRPERMLAYYCRRFPLVELNFTFYRLPTGAQLVRLAEQTPAGFQFLVKMPRTISHERADRELAGFRLAVDALRSKGRLLGVLAQFPQAFHNVAENRDWCSRLMSELSAYSLAVEFRHYSWFRPDVASWLGEKQVDLVAVDVPELPALYPRGLVQSTPRIYVRFHSRNAARWYQSDKERYDYDYADEEMAEWLTALKGSSTRAERALLLFNNCHRAQAVENAQRMQELVARLGDKLEMVQPPAAPPAEQRLLFD
jgi:uncharacterized protein YecE (DUF72 family)